jgi:hypothetical protein
LAELPFKQRQQFMERLLVSEDEPL